MRRSIFLIAFASLLWVADFVGAAEFRGVVTRVDLTKQELAVDGRGLRMRGLSMSFHVGPQTQVMFGNQKAQLTDVSVGRNIRVYYEARDGVSVATLLEVSGPKPKAAPPGQPGAPTIEIASKPGGPAASAGDIVRGVLRRVGYTDREIIVIIPPQAGVELETTLLVADNAVIVKNGKPLPFEELKEGEEITARTEKRPTGLTAVAIQIGPGDLPQANQSSKPEEKIAKVRQVLKVVDFILGIAEQQMKK